VLLFSFWTLGTGYWTLGFGNWCGHRVRWGHDIPFFFCLLSFVNLGVGGIKGIKGEGREAFGQKTEKDIQGFNFDR